MKMRNIILRHPCPAIDRRARARCDAGPEDFRFLGRSASPAGQGKGHAPKPTISQNIVFVAPYRVNLEFRRNLPKLEVIPSQGASADLRH